MAAKKRKQHNLKARIDRSARALLKTNHAAVANIEPPDRQIMVNWKHCTQIRSAPVANALCDIAHRWTVYISVFCETPAGEQYSKSIQFTTHGVYLVASLAEYMEQHHADLCESANAKHVIGSGWLAVPDAIDLTEEQANKVFKTMGAWSHKKAA
jgi:hypothetical protein